jgi:hypothetical protein
MSRRSFLDRHKGKSVSHLRAPKQERELAARGRGRITPGSGAFDQKGDVKKYNGIFRIEAKVTKNKSFSVTREMVRKIEDAALPNGELPAIVIEFIDEFGNPEMEVAVVPTWMLDHEQK